MLSSLFFIHYTKISLAAACHYCCVSLCGVCVLGHTKVVDILWA